jgi:hypothetical protein
MGKPQNPAQSAGAENVGGMSPSSGGLEATGRALACEKIGRAQDFEAVEFPPEQFGEIRFIKREQDGAPGQGGEEDGAVFGSGKEMNPVEANDVVHEGQLAA